MNDLQVWDDGIVHVLPKERLAIDAVERDTVWKLDQIDLFLLG